MFTITGQAIPRQCSTDESGEPPLWYRGGTNTGVGSLSWQQYLFIDRL